jgi:hypothetical protein
MMQMSVKVPPTSTATRRFCKEFSPVLARC